ncbi:MAG: hypothetical protein IT548_15830 [Alphaproteobacteria bacterium]|nr:hypothetical protein [Alphaproteobacteria bacterium]
MRAVTISNVPAGVVSFHRREADAKATSLENHLRTRLVAETRRAHDAVFIVMAQFHAAMEARYGQTGSMAAAVADLRALRAERTPRRLFRARA